MKILIIEDEKLIAEDLIDVLQSINPNIEIVKHISSVQEGFDFFKKTPAIDLIFSDIQLGDGVSFEIFNKYHIKTPIIFCTAYDSYAIEAFKVNGVDYLLKPFSTQKIQDALIHFQHKMQSFSKLVNNEATLLVHKKDKLIPITIQKIAVCYIHFELTYIRTFQNDQFIINKSLDELDALLGDQFYRTNRQVIVNRDAVVDVSVLANRKLAVNLNVQIEESITVSKEKMTSFKNWLKHD